MSKKSLLETVYEVAKQGRAEDAATIDREAGSVTLQDSSEVVPMVSAGKVYRVTLHANRQTHEREMGRLMPEITLWLCDKERTTVWHERTESCWLWIELADRILVHKAGDSTVYVVWRSAVVPFKDREIQNRVVI